MIYLNKPAANPTILELTSKSSFTPSYYLFQFIQDINPTNITYFTGTDTSNYLCRYNSFNIIVTGSSFTNLTGSTIALTSGSYTYNIYESSASTLTLSATTGIVIDTGKVIVNGPDTSVAEVYR